MLRYRLISGSLLAVALVCSVTWLPVWLLMVLLTAASCLAQWEFYRLADAGGIPVFRFLGTGCGLVLILVTFPALGPGTVTAAYHGEHAVLVLSLIAVFIRQLPRAHGERPLLAIGFTALGILYVPYLLGFFTRLALTWDGRGLGARLGATGRLLVLYLILVVKAGDMGAYFVGKRWGRRKLFARLSPAKTWEGLWGGVAASLAVSLLFQLCAQGHWTAVHIGPGDAAVLGLILAAAGVAGDLSESLVKRAVGVKDSSSSIPGMGGLLDVLDSLVFAAPVFYVYVWVFAS